MFETVVLVLISVLCGTVLGFWLGRVSAGYSVGQIEEGGDEKPGEAMQREEEESIGGNGEARLHLLKEHREGGTGRTGNIERNRLWYEKRMLDEAGAYSIGSPVAGVVTECQEGKRPEVILYPAEEKLYAPASGKVIRIMPLGNEMLFRTEEGTVLRILVGDGVDELQSEYFCPKVIQNEVVNRGKLLLEFDKKALEEEGVECTVSVRAEEVGISHKITNFAGGRVKTGQEIFAICRM